MSEIQTWFLFVLILAVLGLCQLAAKGGGND